MTSMDDTFASMVAAQAQILMHASKRLDTHGYLVTIGGLNKDGKDNRFGFGYMIGGLHEMARAWAKAKNVETVIVNVWPDDSDISAIREDGKPLDHGFHTNVVLRPVRRYKPIISSLELFSAKMEALDPEKRKRKLKTGVRYRSGTGVLTMTEQTDNVAFYGPGRAALETIMRVLNMPDHRHLLRGGAFTVKENKHWRMIGMKEE